MNVDSEGGLRYTLFSNKEKKVTVHTRVYSNEKSAAHRSVGAVMKKTADSSAEKEHNMRITDDILYVGVK